jgi:hypothetical protein
MAAFALAFVALGALGCKSSGSGKADASDSGTFEAGGNGDSKTDRGDVPDSKPCVAGTKATGDPCGCNLECSSGFCADGVCCTTACTDGCKTCNAPNSAGTCVNRATGDDPRDATTCVKQPVATCGLDGKCDGLGACRKYPVNVMCKAGTCEGDAVVGSSVCDGAGHCKPGPTRICVPFSCNPNTGSCYESCTASSQCVSGQQCQNGSCGKRMKGATCTSNDQCVSNFCADGVCCNVACQGACVSCNLTGREGTCWPLEADKPDPHNICRDAGRTSCGQTGLCDGFGGCSKYARDVECKPSSCTGNRQITKATCDGRGTCQEPSILECYPFTCRNGACTETCTTNADCDTGIACVNGTCGPKMDGQPCTASSECLKNHCVDGVCCDQACTGACRSCSLSASLGRCTPIAAGTVDPRGVCVPMAQGTCKTNGKCDGFGGCQNWPVGTLCADETCNANVYKAPSVCNATGQCVAPDVIPCSPYTCNGTRCFTQCVTNTQCVNPFICAANSCGLKELGASCSAGSECKSTFCAQGVCCDGACNTACKSCIAGQLGVCSNVATGSPDPAGLCATQDQSTCGTNGKCEAGACQRWLPGTPCLPATCPTTTNLFTPLSACDGAGACVTPTTSSCFPYRCGNDACKATCTADADCLPPAVCVNGGCGLKPNGAQCGNKNECLSGFCEQGVCCGTACTGVCKSCALSASRGTCSNIAAGDPDILSRCSDQGAPSCGTDGRCDGRGACRLYDASTVCAGASCPTGQSTQINQRTCNGLGVCQAATTQPCAPYVCNGSTACLGACTSDGDCLPPNICDPQTNRCGNKKRLGQSCATTNDCLTGNYCVDGVCCSTSACALCQSCNVGTSAGNCTFTPLGNADSRCTPTPPCGNTGACNGAGACQLAATTVSCGTQSCTGSTYTPVSHCNGMGSCPASSAQNCSPYMCGTDTCRNTCAMDSHCVAPFTCQGTAPNRNCALKPNGQACTAGNQCISGNCINGVCCGSAACGTCQTCNGTAPGTCTPLAAGTPAPTGQCPAAAPCGNTGTCNGASGCTQGATTVSCGLPTSCNGTTYQPPSFCSGSGTCAQTNTASCGNYICGTNMCRTDCTADIHCSSTSLYCTGDATTPGSCVAKKANSATCSAANQCASGNCTDGVCCSTSSCGVCQSCSINGAGTCANVPSGVADAPHCAPNGVCGNTGFCNGAGACQQEPASKKCGLAESCSGTTYQPTSNCSGSGTCNQTSTQDCGAYLCGTTQCRTTCASDGDCATGNYCASGSCVAKKGLGAGCTAANQCASGACTDGACCGTGSCPTCQSCGLNGLGTCSVVGLGTTDPHGRCGNTGPCGNTGACDGNGSCQQQPNTLQCGAAVSCSAGSYQPASFCSGSGTCNQMSPVACAPYVCNAGGTACLGTCADDTQCVSGTYCTGPNGSCAAKKAPGATCNAAHECATSNCVDGVCCTTSGCGVCQACNVNGQGTCAPVGTVQPESEPHGRCGPNGTCGNTGFCVNGACAQVAAGTVCATSSCPTATTFQPASTCNGSGICSPETARDCSPYLCGTGSCQTTCADDSQCVGGTYCDGTGHCASKLTLGTPCGRDGECGSTHCTEGVCCGDASCGTCHSCRVANNEGTCTAVPNNTADARCPSDAPSTCGTTGLCESGICQLHGLSTLCSTSCNPDPVNGDTFTRTYCDGMRGCTQAQVETCVSSGACDVNGCVP